MLCMWLDCEGVVLMLCGCVKFLLSVCSCVMDVID